MENFNQFNQNLEDKHLSYETPYMKNLIKMENETGSLSEIFQVKMMVINDAHQDWITCLDTDGGINLVHKKSMEIESIPYEIGKPLNMEFYVGTRTLSLDSMEAVLFPRTVQGLRNYLEFEDLKTTRHFLNSSVATLQNLLATSPVDMLEVKDELEFFEESLEELAEDIQDDTNKKLENTDIVSEESLNDMIADYNLYSAIYQFIKESFEEKEKNQQNIWTVLGDYYNLNSSLHNLNVDEVFENIPLEELQKIYSDISEDNSIMLLEDTLISLIDKKLREGFE